MVLTRHERVTATTGIFLALPIGNQMVTMFQVRGTSSEKI
jgi:hypothetical protein